LGAYLKKKKKKKTNKKPQKRIKTVFHESVRNPKTEQCIPKVTLQLIQTN